VMRRTRQTDFALFMFQKPEVKKNQTSKVKKAFELVGNCSLISRSSAFDFGATGKTEGESGEREDRATRCARSACLPKTRTGSERRSQIRTTSEPEDRENEQSEQ
jgi:hypothetical protein